MSGRQRSLMEMFGKKSESVVTPRNDDVGLPMEVQESGELASASETTTNLLGHKTPDLDFKKRLRLFQEKWKYPTTGEARTWLFCENAKMFCSLCKRYDKSNATNVFLTGCSSMRLENVTSHENSKTHQLSKAADRALKKGGKIELGIKKMEQKDLEQLEKIFDMVFYIIVYEKSFRDLPGLVNLHKKLGSKVSESYVNDKQVRTFLYFIAEVYRDKLKALIEENSFISIMNDGCVDRGVLEEEIIYIRLIEQGRPVTKFLTIKNVHKADAQNIFTCIVTALSDVCRETPWQEKLIGYTCDGAAVQMGIKNGVAAKIKGKIPHLVTVHCMAHVLELALKDSFKVIPYNVKFEECLLAVYKLYHCSSLNRGGLLETGKALGISIVIPVNILGTRWASHRDRAINNIRKSWKAIVVHTSQIKMGKTTTASSASFICKSLCSLKFVLMLNFYSRYFRILSDLSLYMQLNEATVCGVGEKLFATKQKLANLRDGEFLKELFKDVEDQKYQEQDLTLEIGCRQSQEVLDTVKGLCTRLLTSTIDHLSKRYESLGQFEAFKVFDPKNWPSDPDLLKDYGNEEVAALAKKFKTPLENKGLDMIENCIDNWIEIKLQAAKLVKRDHSFLEPINLWKNFLLANQYEGILDLIHIFLIIPVSSAEAERGFSFMNRVKNDWRTRLSSDTLADMMMIIHSSLNKGGSKTKLKETAIMEFDSTQAITKWWNAKKRKPSRKKCRLSQTAAASTSSIIDSNSSSSEQSFSESDD